MWQVVLVAFGVLSLLTPVTAFGRQRSSTAVLQGFHPSVAPDVKRARDGIDNDQNNDRDLSTSTKRECKSQQDLLQFIQEHYSKFKKDDESADCKRGGPCPKYLNETEYRPLKIELDYADDSVDRVKSVIKEDVSQWLFAMRAAAIFYAKTLSVIPSTRKASYGTKSGGGFFNSWPDAPLFFGTTRKAYGNKATCNSNTINVKPKYMGPAIICEGSSHFPGWCELVGWENSNRTETDPDVLVHVRAIECPPHDMADTIAYANKCDPSTDTDIGRPTAFMVTWCLEKMRPNAGKLSSDAMYRNFLRTAVHEMAHGLGFAFSSLAKLRDKDNEYRRFLPDVPKSLREILISLIKSRILILTDKVGEKCPCASNSAKFSMPQECEDFLAPMSDNFSEMEEKCFVYLSLPKVKFEAQRYFDCSTLLGAPFTLQGGGHWLSSVLSRDVISPSMPSFVEDMIVSRMSLAVLDGWYRVDYKMATPIHEGIIPAKGAGCDVATGKATMSPSCPEGGKYTCSTEHFGFVTCSTGALAATCENGNGARKDEFGSARLRRCLMNSSGSPRDQPATVALEEPGCFNIECEAMGKYNVFLLVDGISTLFGSCEKAGETLTNERFVSPIKVECADPSTICKKWPANDVTNKHPFASNILEIEMDAAGLKAVQNAINNKSGKLDDTVEVKKPLFEDLRKGSELIFPKLADLKTELKKLSERSLERERPSTTSLVRQPTIVALFRHPTNVLPVGGITAMVKEADSHTAEERKSDAQSVREGGRRFSGNLSSDAKSDARPVREEVRRFRGTLSSDAKSDAQSVREGGRRFSGNLSSDAKNYSGRSWVGGGRIIKSNQNTGTGDYSGRSWVGGGRIIKSNQNTGTGAYGGFSPRAERLKMQWNVGTTGDARPVREEVRRFRGTLSSDTKNYSGRSWVGGGRIIKSDQNTGTGAYGGFSPRAERLRMQWNVGTTAATPTLSATIATTTRSTTTTTTTTTAATRTSAIFRWLRRRRTVVER